MKKIKIGIPRAFLYYRYGQLWKTYFSLLGCKIILSPETNTELLNIGISNSNDENCLSYKIYLGHAIYLSKTCDYILVPHICNYGKNNTVCPKLNNIYNILKEYISSNQLLNYDIDHIHYKYQSIGLLKLGFKFTKNPLKIIYSYLIAKEKQKKYNINKQNEEKNKLLKQDKKILIISYFYIIEDNYIMSYIKEYLKNNNIIPIYCHNLDKKTSMEFSEYFSSNIYWKYSKEMMGALYYYKYQINGIIFISSYNCSIDSYVNNLAITKNKDIPILNLIIDEYTYNLDIETKLESFLDIINVEYNK